MVKRKKKNGELEDVTCPKVIADCSKYMGSVDLADQKVSLYVVVKKNRKWWRKVFFRMFTVAVHNSSLYFAKQSVKK